MTDGKRDYQKEKRWEHEKNPQRLRDRVKRVQARREAIKAGVVKRFDGKHLDHKVPLSKGGNNKLSNFRAVSPSSNTSFSRNSDGSLRSQTSKRERKSR